MTEEKGSGNSPVDYGEIVQRPRTRISWAWLFPVLAAGAAIWMFWSHWKSSGPEIEVLFHSAPGIQAGKSLLYYRGVEAGKVTRVRLDAGLDKVVVSIRLKAYASDLAREGTEFWVDQPEVSLDQISGLDAIIQGNSIQARIGTGAPATRFMGSDRPPLTPLEAPSLVLQLHAMNIPFVDRGSPVYFRGVAVGEVESKGLDPQGIPVLRVVVEKEFAKAVRTNSRFWVVPATSLQVGPNVLKLDVAGLDAIVRGGIAFDTFEPLGGDVASGSQFELAANEMTARSYSPPIRVSFDDGRGLIPGQTEVTYLGMPIGFVEEARPDSATGAVEAVIRLQPHYDSLRNAGTIFTLVRPRISLEGVSGLETIVGGVYIACSPGSEGERKDNFVGRAVSDEEWDRAQSEGEGLEITLYAREIRVLEKGAPVFYRGVAVGRIREKAFDEKGSPFLRVVVRKEFSQFVRKNSRFWRMPATSIQAGPGVMKVAVEGVETLLQGGVAFDDFGSPGENVATGSRFELFNDERSARSTSLPIRISFNNGQGLLAGQTQLRYLGIPVGLVEEIRPSAGKIEVVARLEPGFEILRRRGSKFLLVRPQISLEGVSGLETLVSGVYIDCEPSSGGELAQRFVGTTREEIAMPRDPLRIVVAAPNSKIGLGAPVYYRGLRVGKVIRKELSTDGRSVDLFTAIDRQYSALVRENTKFWDVSGVKASLGLLGIKIETGTVESLALGGLAFATPEKSQMGGIVKSGHRFELSAEPRKEWLLWAPSIPLRDH
ncbi:MAG TPA: MlaD family protein [Terrimicrobiaceae bacterium]